MKTQKTLADLKTKPLDLKFTAADGHEVDLAQMRGKVVLIDFWATWCGPCVAELPNVLKAYEKLHPKGFEIVGISLDSDRAKLETFIKEKNMTWPQFFDGQGLEERNLQQVSGSTASQRCGWWTRRAWSSAPACAASWRRKSRSGSRNRLRSER